MSRRRQTGRAGARGKRTDVGYGRPPPEHQFKPGQSGNKRGRPKGSKNEATILDELFNRKMDIREGGRVRKISFLEALFLKYAEDALKSNHKAAAFLLNRRQQLGASSERPADDVLDMDDRKVLESYVQQLEEKFNKRGESE
ncbi:hypothetical protein JQ596_11435 [Bradyrhizobium manausense]|uniref:DUF5681 domain-containing protein n=1 Tax=Bradyrhizobium manausense TaxID=989370 RepID=UPI001BA68721|nr:DUF5681 domain-containing protein [Bradyrhizobium manausense]MBR0826153.1 hypothetical protein [Bradyrhizobium manausense]